MATFTTKFNVGDECYLRDPAARRGELVKAKIEEIIVSHTMASHYPYVIRYRIYSGAIIQRKTRWLEDDLLTKTEATTLARKILKIKTLQAQQRERSV